jgi:trafficking protein particle complex subunit 11
MDQLPQDYVLHNLPLLLLSGLSTKDPAEPDPSGKTYESLHQGGFRIKVDASPVQGPLAQLLLLSFCDQDASNVSWHTQSFASRNGKIFKIATVGRVGQRTRTLEPDRRPER